MYISPSFFRVLLKKKGNHGIIKVVFQNPYAGVDKEYSYQPAAA